jgi:hypothetical protein
MTPVPPIAAHAPGLGLRCHHVELTESNDAEHRSRGARPCPLEAVAVCGYAFVAFGADPVPCRSRYCADHGREVPGRGPRCWRHA